LPPSTFTQANFFRSTFMRKESTSGTFRSLR
jgi:hypothetical protein